MKSSAKSVNFHWWKCIWKCRLRNGGNLSRPQCVKPSMRCHDQKITLDAAWGEGIPMRTPGSAWEYKETRHRADSRLAPSQWETSLQSNAVSHWLGANLESALKKPVAWFLAHYEVITNVRRMIGHLSGTFVSSWAVVAWTNCDQIWWLHFLSRSTRSFADVCSLQFGLWVHQTVCEMCSMTFGWRAKG